MMDFEHIPDINVDCVIGFGDGCRIAQYLKINNLRFFSMPFDWQMNYDLETVFLLLKNKGKIFLKIINWILPITEKIISENKKSKRIKFPLTFFFFYGILLTVR